MKRRHSLRTDGRAVEALLLLFKQLTAHARWVFAALLALYAFSGIRMIQSHEQALLVRFGRIQPQVHGPGLLVGMPEPFDKVLRFETGKEVGLDLDRWKTTGAKIGDPNKAIEPSNEQLVAGLKENRGGAALTKFPEIAGKTLDPVVHGYSLSADLNVVQGCFQLRYRIEDPFHYIAAGDKIEELLSRLTYRALSRQMASRKIDASLTSERREVAEGAARDVQEDATTLDLGIRVSGIDIRELTPPSQVIAAFEDVTNAKQFAKTLFENSRQYESEQTAKAEGEAASILHRAEAHASGLVAVAEGEASSFGDLLARYRLQGDLVSRRLLRETLDTVMDHAQSRTLLPVDRAQPSLLLEPSPQMSR